ncbi:MAG TPA: hypothetical protein P5013_05090 [Methanoregula sp.]|nr:hypothetical protein [Methanoregula sp.]
MLTHNEPIPCTNDSVHNCEHRFRSECRGAKQDVNGEVRFPCSTIIKIRDSRAQGNIRIIRRNEPIPCTNDSVHNCEHRFGSECRGAKQTLNGETRFPCTTLIKIR